VQLRLHQYIEQAITKSTHGQENFFRSIAATLHHVLEQTFQYLLRASRRKLLTQHATGNFTIDTWNEQPFDEREGAKLSRTHAVKTFQGDLEGTSTAELLMARGQEEGSAAYAGFERIEGSLHG